MPFCIFSLTLGTLSSIKNNDISVKPNSLATLSHITFLCPKGSKLLKPQDNSECDFIGMNFDSY